MIFRRLPASSSFVLAAARLRALQLDPGRAAAGPGSCEEGHRRTVSPARTARVVIGPDPYALLTVVALMGAADRVCLPCLSAERAFPVAGAGGAVRRVQQPGVENRSISGQSRCVAGAASSTVIGGRVGSHDGSHRRRGPGRPAGREDGLSHVPAWLSRELPFGQGRERRARGWRAGEGVVMDPVVAAFGTALIGAIATDAWQQVRAAVTGLWRRVHPRREDDGIEAELDELREQVLVARRDGDAGTERALEGAWQLRLQQLLRADPGLAAELQRVLDQVLTPALTPAEQTRIENIIMTGSSHDSSTFTQIGTQTNYNRP